VDVTSEMRQIMSAQAGRFEVPALLDCLRLFNTAASDVRGGWQPGLLLELALAEAVSPKVLPAAVEPPAAAARSPHAAPAAAQPVVQAPAAANAPAAHTPPPAAHQPPVIEKKHAAAQAQTPANKVPAAETTPAKAEAAGPSGKKVEMTTIQQNWSRIKQTAKDLKVNMSGLLNSCTLVAIKDGALVIGFSSDVLKQKMEAEDNLRMARQAILKVTGLDVPVMCVVVGNKSNPGGPDLDIEGDGIVGTALNLGGQIVHKGKTD
jgi:DNA polymerase III subunit gamma/tau